MMESNNTTIRTGTIVFWIEANKLIYNDGNDDVIFSVNPDGGSIFMHKNEKNCLEVVYVVLGKGNIGLFYDVSNLDSSKAHNFVFTRNIDDKISLYIDGKLVCDKKVQF